VDEIIEGSEFEQWCLLRPVWSLWIKEEDFERGLCTEKGEQSKVLQIFYANRVNVEQLMWLFLLFVMKVKQPHYRPGHAKRVPGDWGPQNFRHSASESGKIVSPKQRPPIGL